MDNNCRLYILLFFSFALFFCSCASGSKTRVNYIPLEDRRLVTEQNMNRGWYQDNSSKSDFSYKNSKGSLSGSPSLEDRRFIIIKRNTDKHLYQVNPPKTSSVPENNKGNASESPQTTERRCCYRSDLEISKQGSEEIRKKNDSKPDSIETKKLLDFVPPLVNSVVTSPFGIRREHPVDGRKNRLHLGVDLRADYGSPVFSVNEGVVSAVFRKTWLGLGVEIDHGNGFKSVYGHLSKIIVNEREKVMAGEKIGYSGDTGVVTGPHLHLEIWRDGKPLDPKLFIKFTQ